MLALDAPNMATLTVTSSQQISSIFEETSMASSESSALHVRLLGEFLLSYKHENITCIDLQRMSSLLAYLMLHHDVPQERAHLAFLFWPDSTDAQALGNLRTLVHRLRNVLPDADNLLYVGRHALQWRPDIFWRLDVIEFEQAVAHAEQADTLHEERQALERAITLYKGDLLPSCYDEWIFPERDRLRQMFFSTLKRLALVLEQEHEYDAAIRVTQRLLQDDPLQEESYRQLMHLYTLQEDFASAIRVYRTCSDILLRELGVPPAPATCKMYEHLLQHSKVGKTRLTEEFVSWIEQQESSTEVLRSFTIEGNIADGSLATLLKTEAAQAALLTLANVWLTESARVLPDVLTQRPDLIRSKPSTEHRQCQHFFEALAHAMLYTPLMF